MESVAVFSRISECDLPFYRQWLEYYTKIGIDKFYITGSHEYSDLPFFKNYDVNFFPCIHHEDEKKKMEFFTHLIKANIKQDYVLMIDVDEYLATDNIKEIIKDGQINYFFSWFMIPSLFTEYKNMYDQSAGVRGFNLTQGKSLHRTVNIDNVFNYHFFNKPVLKLVETNNILCHFRFRGLRDIINKCYTSDGYTEWHKNDSVKLNKFLSEDKLKLEEIPNRIILAAAEYYCLNKREQKILPINCENSTDFSYFNCPVNINDFEKRFKLLLDNLNLIFKEFEFKQYCKSGLIDFLKRYSALKV